MTTRTKHSVDEQKQLLELHNTGHCGVAVTVNTWTQGGASKAVPRCRNHGQPRVPGSCQSPAGVVRRS